MDALNTESISFSQHLATIYVETQRLASKICKENYGVTLTQFELLLTLQQATDPLMVRSLSEFLFLKPASVRLLASELEDKGLVATRSAESDQRFAVVELTEAGAARTLACDEEVSAFFGMTTRAQLPEQEFHRHFFDQIAQSLDFARGYGSSIEMDPTRVGGMRVEFHVFSRVLIERWRGCVASRCEMSFNEFRALYALVGTPSLRVQDLAAELSVTRSQASTFRKRLAGLGFAQERPNPFDGRSVLLTATKEGVRFVRAVQPELDRITSITHDTGSAEGNMTLRSWHSRMYLNLRRFLASGRQLDASDKQIL